MKPASWFATSSQTVDNTPTVTVGADWCPEFDHWHNWGFHKKSPPVALAHMHHYVPHPNRPRNVVWCPGCADVKSIA